MIKIENSNIENIQNIYKTLLYNWLYKDQKYKKKQKNKIWKDRFKSKIKGNRNQYQKMLSFVDKNLNEIISYKLTGLPDFVEMFSKEFDNELKAYKNAAKEKKGNTSFGKFKATMESLYNDFFKYEIIIDNKKKSIGNWLASQLDVNVCPYCNRQYTFTISTIEAKTRPQFDHFKPKSIYPYFALSFYNLIPSCPTCNHLKGEKEIEIHPYSKAFENEYKFILDTPKGKAIEKGDYKIKLCDIDDNTNKNIDILGLNPLYEGHIDYVDEILDKALGYNSAYYNSLINSYSGLGKQPSEIDRFIWGVYLEETEHCKRPLSKLTRDVLEQLKIK